MCRKMFHHDPALPAPSSGSGDARRERRGVNVTTARGAARNRRFANYELVLVDAVRSDLEERSAGILPA